MTSTPTRPHAARAWWAIAGGLGLLLTAVPALALAVTHRAPDPLFLGHWWSPLASVPTETLLVGSAGIDLLLATAITAVVARFTPHLLRLACVLVGTAALLGGTLILSAVRSDATASAITAQLTDDRSRAPGVSAEAVEAIRLGAALPGTSPNEVRIVQRSSLPAGPLIVQTTEAVNTNLDDEGADVTLGSLVDPIDGSVIAAWFWGL